ncbi:hypothetical protein EMIT0P218_130119 [Pseudomonas sp. IT-P218]
MKASGFFVASVKAKLPDRASSLASQLLQGFAVLMNSRYASNHASGFFVASVKAKLPDRASSPASQLLQGFAVFMNSRYASNHCRSWLASEEAMTTGENLTEEIQPPDSPQPPDPGHA